MTSRRLLTAWACALALAACASSPPVRYFSLKAIARDYPEATAGAAVMVLGPLTFPEYLERPQMVRRGAGAELLVDEFNRWAEPLDEALPRIVAANVDALTDALVVVPFVRRTITPDYRLFATVQRFDTDDAGHTELVVQWGVTGRDGQVIVAPRTDRYRARASPAADPGAVATAMSDAVAGFSRAIVATLEPRVAAHAAPAAQRQ